MGILLKGFEMPSSYPPHLHSSLETFFLRIPMIMPRLLNLILSRAKGYMAKLLVGSAVLAAPVKWHVDHAPLQSALCDLLQSAFSIAMI